MRFGIEEADRKSASVAMISSNPRNIPFYGRHGFTALSTKISAGVVITGMIRLKAQKKIDVLLTQDDDDDKGAAGGGGGGGGLVSAAEVSAITEITKTKED